MTDSKWAVVTGATGGLGRAFARELVKRGRPVMLVSRRRAELDLLAREIQDSGGRAQVVVADLATPNGIDTVVAAAARVGGIGVLVNNAGFGTFGPLLAHAPERDLNEVALNVGAVVALTRALLPEMIERGHGQIVNVASMLSFMPTPYFSVYGATKAFILHFTEALAEELRGSGVRALAVCPGVIKTDFFEAAGSSLDRQRLPPLQPETVARAALDAANAARTVRVVGAIAKLLVSSTRITPRFLMRRIMAVVFRSSLPPEMRLPLTSIKGHATAEGD
jgi:short-subunit dehydrogenase